MTVFLKILGGVFLTAISETVFLSFFGFRDKKFILSSLFINAFTNVILNLCVELTGIKQSPNYTWILIASEIGVVIVETLFLLYIDKLNKRYQLIPLVVSSNCLSFLLGIIYYLVIGA